MRHRGAKRVSGSPLQNHGLNRRESPWRLLCHVVALLLIGVSASAAPAADPWPFWAESDPGASAAIDFSFWNGFLARYLKSSPDGINRVAYGAVTPSDRQGLDNYLARLAAVPVRRYSRPQQMA